MDSVLRGAGSGAGAAHPLHGLRRIRPVALGAVGTAVAVTAGVLMATSSGYAASSVASTEASVWVTNNAQYLVGRVNRQIDELESAVLVDGSDYDVLQDGRTVIVVDPTGHRMRTLDPTAVSLSSPIDLPAAASVVMGGGTLAVADTASGAVWLEKADDLDDVPVADTTPAFTSAPGVAIAAGEDGSVATAAPKGSTLTVLGPDGTRTEQRLAAPDLPAVSLAYPDPVAVTMVGATPVVLDRPGNRILVGDKAFPLPDGSHEVVLQQSGAASDAVLVATDSALLRISLADGTIQSFAPGVQGTPAAPVWLGGCANGAWGGDHPTYLGWCNSVPTIRQLPSASGQTRLVFRVNRDQMVLNDVLTGTIWVPDHAMAVINNWSQVAPQNNSDTDDQPDADTDASNDLTLSRTDCTKASASPTAKADSFGVRAGHPTVLRVMDNDATSDCSVSVIDSVDAAPADGTVQIVDDGRALQIIPAGGATGVLPAIGYRISDGQGHASSASVTVTVVPAGTSQPPKKIRPSAMVIASGGTASHNVLADWISPSGDALFLSGAALQGAQNGDQSGGDTLSYASDGTITLRDSGAGGATKKTVTFVVSDGVNTAQGTLTVDVVPDANLVPVPSPVYARTVVGRPVTVDPLATVLSVGSDPLRLSAVTPPAGEPALHLQSDLDSGTATISADTPGTYYLGFQVTAGSQPATGVIRVDVVQGAAGAAPVAVGDVAYLSPGGSARVDLTANDSDPEAGVLAVQQTTVDASSPLQVRVTDMHIAEITSRRALPAGGAWFSYTLAAGAATATGWVHVIGVKAAPQETPIASPISLVVRAGDAVSQSVTGFAVDPGGSALTVQDFDPLPAGSGVLFASGDSIRYLAPVDGLARPLHTTYTVANDAGRTDTAPLTIRVVPAGTNQPPRTPQVVTARVFAGSTVTIGLPLDGIDPDGDWVIATGIDSSPASGTAAVVGPSTVSYTASDTAGIDTFSYTVADPFGATSTGTVVVGVVPQPSMLAPPVAPGLQVAVLPGKSIGIDVLSTVTDPAGYAVQFAPNALGDSTPTGGVTAKISDGVLVVTAGSDQTVVPISYTVVNAKGLTATGVVTVTVSKDAQPVPPTAADVYVDKDMLTADGTAALVDVSSAVSNPGGMLDELIASVPTDDPSGIATAGRLQYRVSISGQRQVFAYQVGNDAGAIATALIIVPGANELVPADDLPNTPQTATSSAPATPTQPAGSPTTGPTAPTVPTTTAAPAPKLASRPLQVAPGGHARVDLADLVTPANVPGRTLRYSGPEGAGSGVTASLSGSVLTVSAGIQVPGGTSVPLTVSVSDGEHPAASATIAVTVVLDADPPTVPDVTVDGNAGEATSVDVLANAINPLSAQGGLTLVDAQVADGQGQLTYSPGGTITVTPPRTATAPVTVQFTVQDPTKSPDRMVTGYLTINVLGLPDAPGAPTVVSSGDGVVVLKWAVPDDHGARITGYSVSGGPSGPQSCPKSPCTISGLSNGTTYRFTAVAHNAVGDSPSSAASAPVRPDVAPDAPDAPTLTFGDGEISASWKAPANHGSAITGYQVSISPGPTVSTAKDVTSYRFSGLTNGTSYQVTVVALNGSGTPSDSSPPATEVPAAKPDVPGAPTVSSAQEAGTGGQVDVSWTQVDGHGDRKITYTVSWTGDDGSKGTVAVAPGRPLTATIRNIKLGTRYSARVSAANKAGSSGPGAAGTVSPYTAPGLIDDLTATPTGSSGQVTLGWSAPAANGRPITAYQYHDGDGQWKAIDPADPAATSLTVDGLTNGQQYGFVVRACNTDDANNCGPTSKAAPASPYQPPSPPQSLAADADPAPGQLVLSWAVPADSGGREVAGYQYAIAGSGTWVDAGNVTSVTVGDLTNGRSYDYQVRAYTAEKTANVGGSADVVATPYDVPGAPQNLTAAAGENKVTLTFSAPGSDGGSAVTSYQYSMDGGAWTAVSSGGAVSMGDWSKHSFQVRAVNKRGPGGVSNAASASAYGPVGGVHGLGKTSSDQDTINFSWSKPDDNGVNGWSYQYKRAAQSSWTATGSTSGSRGGLSCGTTYSIQVRAIDGDGHVGPITEKDMSTDACPTPPSIQIVAGANATGQPGCTARCNYIAFTYSHFSGGSYHAKVYVDNMSTPWRQYDFSLSAGSGKHQFTSYLGDHSINDKYHVKIVISGADNASDERDFPNTG